MSTMFTSFWHTTGRVLQVLLLLLPLLWALALLWYVDVAAELKARGIAQLDAIVREAEPAADRIVALTGGGGRLEAAIMLLEQHAAPGLLITGVSQGLDLADILPNLPEELECCISIGDRAADTTGNADETRDWLGEQGLLERSGARVILVSAHYHLPRALAQFQQTMPDIVWLGYAVEPKDLPLDKWYQYTRGWRIYSIELLKFLWVRLHG